MKMVEILQCMESRVNKLNEIVSKDHIKIILESYSGEQQLRILKEYFLQFTGELREMGIDPSSLAWQIYTTKGKL